MISQAAIVFLLAAAAITINVAQISAFASSSTQRGATAGRTSVATSILDEIAIAILRCEIWELLTTDGQGREFLLE